MKDKSTKVEYFFLVKEIFAVKDYNNSYSPLMVARADARAWVASFPLKISRGKLRNNRLLLM